MDAAEVVKQADEAGLRLVRFLWCGNDGTVRAKASAIDGLEGRIESGIGLTVAMQAMNALDQLQPVDGMGPVGEVRLVPDPATFRVLPYAPRMGAMLVDHLLLTGEPAPVCQRTFLKRMEGRLEQRSTRLECSFENEFSLATLVDGTYVPIDSGLCFSTISATAAQDYVDDLAAALEAQGIVLEQYYSELGHGQHEISTGHAAASKAADEQLLARETIRGVAAKHGLVASLAPKPWPDNAGNGGHIHFSLWDADAELNRFHDASAPDGLSGRRALLSRECSSTCPALRPHGAELQLLPPDRAAVLGRRVRVLGPRQPGGPVRVPSVFRGKEEASTNLELKAADASCNPYLALGGLIAAGLDGLERELEPPEPVEVDPATIDEAERERRGIVRLPETQAEALDALERDEVLIAALGPVLAESYLAVRRSEWAAYSVGDEAFEQQGHFSKY